MNELINTYQPLLKYKNGAETFFLICKIYHQLPGDTRFTKKLCGELIDSTSKGGKCYDILMKINAIHLDNGKYVMVNSKPELHKLDEESTEEKEVKSFASTVYSEFKGDYRSILSYSRSSHSTIQSEANRLGYELDGYLSQIHSLIKGDSFWSKVITGQTFIRKFDVLSKKFTPTKNISSFNDVGSIF